MSLTGATPPAIVILCTVPAEGEHARRLATGLVEARLAACVNILPGLQSVFRWQGSVATEPETQLVIKTRPEHFDRVVRWLGEHHPYDVPEVLAVPVLRGAEAYLAWLDMQTTPSA